MPSLMMRNKRRIREAIELLKDKRKSIDIRIEGQETPFTSKIVNANHGDVLSGPGMGGTLLIDILRPESGNEFLQPARPLKASFSLGRFDCEFKCYFVKKNEAFPHYGHVITYPESILIVNRRRYDRHERDASEAPLFLDATLTLRAGQNRNKSYDIKVFDISGKGVGILVGEEMEELLQHLNLGHRVEELDLLAEFMTIKVSGTVRHKSRINEGKYSGFHLIGIELDEELEDYI